MHLLKTMQMNIGRNEEEMIELLKYAHESDIDLIMIQEPYTRSQLAFSDNKKFKLISKSTGGRAKSTIAIKPNLKHLLDDELTDENHVIVVINEDVFVSSYFNLEEADGKRKVESDLNLIQRVIDKYHTKSIFLFSDSNSRNEIWGDKITNSRGHILYEFILQNQLQIMNDTTAGPTYVKYANERLNTSNIDLTLINQRASRYKIEWTMSERQLNTEHQLISVVIEKPTRIKYTYQQIKKVNYKDSDWRLLRMFLINKSHQ